ncbi:titin isoform X1 [Drosophila sulfurigaster albostrigata]|uniref:titin isoform X1 n=1 Tax=Drosophila sulfurigaster albostrigata TaxID=89887 RepID=UPI002D219300|nr:titin isoform X1 [Drosophila sulfurigaster albostrigata]
MERRQALDSSMSSLYSASSSNRQQQQQHQQHHQPQSQSQLDAFNYSATMSSSSPTPSQATNCSSLRATTIGTVVVRCGPIQLVIALLQSPEKIYIKVVELEPKITALGDNFDDSLQMQREHDETLRNLQNLPGPMDEFVQKADKLLASKRISSELVNAMADTLNIIWQDILNLLQDRQHILHLCTQFHDKMTLCFRRMDQLEEACSESMTPTDVAGVQEFLNKFKQLRIDMLTGVMAALKDGNELLAQLQELEKLETLDTRPEHIKRDATRAVHQVQQWLEALHDRRNALELAWQTRKTQLEQCLALKLLGRELIELESALQQARHELNSMYSLGECEHSANQTLLKYREWKQQALLLRDRALKITRAKEKVQASGHLAGEEACARAYAVLSGCTEHLDIVDQREHWLQLSRDFFAKAEHTLSVLEKLELELASVKLPPNSPESYAMYAKVSRDVRNFTEEPLRLGYSILDEVGRTQPETQGIKRVLDELENRKAYIEGICANSSEDHERVQRALNEFLSQHNELLAWLRASGQLQLQQSVNMGRNLQQAKQFLLQHHELMQDLEIKGELINLLLESIKQHLESLSPQERYDVDSKAEALHKHWIELKDLVLKRVDYVSLLIEFFEQANELSSQLDHLQRQLQQTPDEHKLQFLQATWANIAGSYAELKSSGQRFINLKIVDPYLETKSSVQAVEETLNGFSKRQIDVTSSLENWTTNIQEKRQVEYLLEKVMSDNEETVAKSTQVDTQLYPVFSTSSLDSKQLLTSTREKLSFVTQDIERAQEEIQQRIQTTLSIQTKDQQSLSKIEQVINNLRMLKAKLDGIKYDYRTLLESVLQFLENIVQLRQEIDAYFARQQAASTAGSSSGVERTIAEHEKFRDQCMDKFRSLITQSELLIDRVRVLEPPGAREIDTDRILKLLENLRIHFESNSSARMSTLERLEKLEQFRNDLDDIDRSLDSVSKQLHDINGQSVDSLAAAKTTSLAFEYFERTIESSMPKFMKLKSTKRHQRRWGQTSAPTIELLEKRIEKFTETTSQQLLISNPESEAYVKDELRKLNDKWQSFKEQVKQKRKSLNQANEFFEVVEKIDAEYREISYFYNSVSNKVPYLRDPVEAANLVNDIEKYVTSRESALRAKLDNASQCAHDMNKVSSLYNDVMNIFQSFVKLKLDINIVIERLKQEQRQREQREREARDQAERDQAIREAEARERLAREEQTRLEAQRQQAAIEQAQRELAARQLSLREQAVREEEARLQAVREQAAREQLAREQAAREEEQRIQTLRDIAKREEELRLQSLREEEARLQTKREEEIRIKREEELRLKREEESRQKREEESRQKREEESRIQREEITRLQTLRDQVDQQRIVTENIRKDIQVNQIFTELRYASPLFVRPLKDALTREGDRFVFECEVTGTPEPSVEWFKDGISIQSNADYKTSFDKGICRLVIEETFAADTARFSCRASNLVGTCDTNATLTVRENAAELQLVPPRIVRFLESGKATEGTSFQFSCVVSGVPLPTVQWFKNDKCIDDSQDYVISYNNGEATLRFEEVFLEDDAVYTCSASNPTGIEHCSASLIVEPLEPTELPCFKLPLQNAMARVGQKIKLEALVSGIPKPDIYWLHNGKPFQPRDLKYENGRVTLIIPQAYPNDAGSYVLSAKNLAGEAYSHCNIIVKGRLPNETSDSEMASDIEPIRPAVHMPLKDVSMFEGKPVRLDCVIVGQPEPEVIWYHNERPVKESADVQLLFQGDRCSLFIQEVYQEDAGNYKVVAINSAGETSSSCELKVTPLNIAEPATRAQAERQSMPKDAQPKFERLLSDALADEGEQVVLEVQASGDQPLRAQWYLTNKELQLNERVTTQSNPEAGIFKLILNNVEANDKGVYTVKVSNNAGDAKCFSHLIVKSVNMPENRRGSQSSVEIVERHLCPEFKELFSDKQAQIDDVVKFECIVVGKPTPKVHWYFNDQPVHGHNFLVSTSGDRQVLTIQQLTHDAVGKISCVAENEAGKATCVAFLNIIGSGLPASSDVQTMTQEHNTESSRVTIKKQTFTTTSTSQVNSYEGNVPQTEVHHSSAHIDQSLKQLGQQRPEIVESHHYQELHKSKEMSSPSVQQKSFTLVQSSNGVPALPDSPTRLRKEIAPRFTTPLTGKIVDQGANVSMEAIYDGFPSPEIKVEKNGDQLFDNEHTKISNKFNRVTIELKEVNVADAGRYAVTASNTVGQSTSTADLVVKKTIFPPVFGRRLQAQVSKKGEKLIMEVEVTGLPEPTVTWLKDDKPIKEAGLSEHRLLAQGNSYKLIIERAKTSDSGKYMVKATNAGGEAKSIADCAILEPSPERMQEVVKTIVYETTPATSEFKTENQFNKEPQSYQTNQSDATTANDLHGLSESKVITEHRCTTEATIRLEHKSNYLDLPELTARPKTPITNNNNNNNTASMDHTDSTQTTSFQTGITPPQQQQQQPPQQQVPPPVPPKPCAPVVATSFGQSEQPPQMQTQINTRYESSTSEHKTSSSFEYFKKMDEETITQRPKPLAQKPIETVVRKPQAQSLAEELRSMNLIPGAPPEFCYTPKGEVQAPRVPLIQDKIKILEEVQPKETPPQGGVPVFPLPMNLQSVQHETTMTKEVKVEYGQPILRPAAMLATPAQQNPRSPSPKPSAEGVAMSKLWTPAGVSGYSSDVEQKSEKQTIITKLATPTPTKELNAPFLVQQVAKTITPATPPTPAPTPVTRLVNIELEPGTPPEICFAPKPQAEEVRRHSLVESMEQKLEQNLVQGPSKVLPHSVPTLTPAAAPLKPNGSIYRPPPPVMPNRLGPSYESDYESDRYKYSGSESDEPRARQQQATMETSFKSSGYAADTEEHSSYRKSETSFYETKSSSSTTTAPPKLQPEPPAKIYFTPQAQPQPQHQNQQSSSYSQEAKNYKYSSSSSMQQSSSSTHHETKYTSNTMPLITPSPVPAQRKTPATEFSDYSSEVDERFRSVSRANESDTDIKGYRVVFPPTPTPRTNIANGHKSPVVVVTPSPMEFEPTPPEVGSYSRPKFEPIGKEIRHEIRTESSSKQSSFKSNQQQPQHVFKPKPVAAKFIAATQQQQQQQPLPSSRPTMYYNAVAGAPMHTAKVAHETKNVMQMHESTESSQRIVNMQQTKRVIHFDNQQQQQQQQQYMQPLEPFPYSPAGSRTPSRQSHLPPPATPTKFIPGEFRESDYESEVEGARIQPLWSPYGDGLTKGYRRVAPPQGGRSCSLPRTYERVLSPMEFDRGPEMPSKIHVDVNTLLKEQRGGSTVTTQHRTQSLNRNSTLRQQQYGLDQTDNQQQLQQQQLRGGTLPRYGYNTLQQQAEGQGKRMGSTFLQKSHQFVEDVSRDMQSSTGLRPGFRRAPSEGSNHPQAYRDESRVSQYGTKCVDPNTGLIYFKYDFGYEFGILFPGEGHKFVSSQWNSKGSSNTNGIGSNAQQSNGTPHASYPLKLAAGNELVIPVQHERTNNKNNLNTGYSSDSEAQRRTAFSPRLRAAAPRFAHKRYSLPSNHSLDIHLDRLHAQAPRLPPEQMVRTVPELPNTEPVNAHLNRDEQAQRPPLFITPLKDIAVGVGGTARFECIVQAHPQPQVNWIHNGGHLEQGSSAGHIIEYRNGVCRLTLPQAYPDDNGSYVCTAVNPLGAASTTGNLNVSSTNRGFRY